MCKGGHCLATPKAYTCDLGVGLIDSFIIYCFSSHSIIFHLYGDAIITGEGLQNLSLCSALRAFEKKGVFIVPHLL
jgi:hypothetical protein